MSENIDSRLTVVYALVAGEQTSRQADKQAADKQAAAVALGGE